MQINLFEEIVARFPQKSMAIVQLMETLSVNRDGVYRRLRGDTPITLGELQKLADKFAFSLDEMLYEGSGKIVFYYSLYEQNVACFQDYLLQLNQHIKDFVKQPELWVYYSSQEMPIFIYMMFPKLLAFKLYVHGLTTWHLDFLRNKPFDFDLVNAHELALAKETCQVYCTVNSTDFWTLSILQQSLSQIEYLAMEGRFKDYSTALEVCHEMTELINHTRRMAEAGKKMMPGHKPIDANGAFDLFHSELAITNNTILSVSKNHYGLYNTFDNPNFLYTNNRRLCMLKKGWFEKIKVYSESMSVHSGKNRNRYFNQLEETVKRTIKRLELIYN